MVKVVKKENDDKYYDTGGVIVNSEEKVYLSKARES
jgi:hypothetical protein